MNKENIDKFFDSLSKRELTEKWSKYNKYSENKNLITINYEITKTTNESLTSKQVMKIANKAGDTVLDAKDELIELIGAYGDKIPKSRVKEILVNYDLNMKGDIS